MEYRGQITRKKQSTLPVARKILTHIRWDLLFYLFFVTGIIMLLIFSTMSYRTVAAMGETLDRLEVRETELEAKRDNLKMQLVPYTKISRIEEIAKTKLDMKYDPEAVPTEETTEVAVVTMSELPDTENPTLLGKISVFVLNLLYR